MVKYTQITEGKKVARKSANPKRKTKYTEKDLENNELSRVILLSEDVEQEPIGELIRQILEINEEDDKLELKSKTHKRRPIKLIVNSFGGSVYDGLGLVDCIDGSKTPVHTICYGSAMSMGFVILACGHLRYAGKYATIMYHELAYEAEHQKLMVHKDDLKESDRLQDLLDQIVLSRTKLNKKTLQVAKNKKMDWYLTADEALSYEIVDEVI